MKNLLFCLLSMGIIMSCANTEGAGKTSNGASNITPEIASSNSGEWKLIEVHIGGRATQYKRDAQIEDAKFFTVSFTEASISGDGAPNRYSAPMVIRGSGNDQRVEVGLVRSTLMASFFEPKHLNEYEFFKYIQNTYIMTTVSNRWEFLSKTEDGRDVKLVFGR